jgi:hypothetical protein
MSLRYGHLMVRSADFCAARAHLIKNNQLQKVTFAVKADISMPFLVQCKGKKPVFTSDGNSFPYRC